MDWPAAVLDFNRDDYYRASIPGCLDLSNSPYLASLVSIAATPADPTIAYGTDQQFNATGTYSDASTTDLTSSVTWAAASPAVATISAGGLAHAVSLGTSTISASVGAAGGSALLTVTKAPQSLTFTPLPNKSYGDADFMLNASASSGLPVSFAADGNCSLTTGSATAHTTSATKRYHTGSTTTTREDRTTRSAAGHPPAAFTTSVGEDN